MESLKNQDICGRFSVNPVKPETGSKLGLAIKSIETGIINGLRHNPENGANGWYIWCGEYSENKDFFSPICYEHLTNYLDEEIKPLLDLPPGYRFLYDGGEYLDVWFDEQLMK